LKKAHTSDPIGVTVAFRGCLGSHACMLECVVKVLQAMSVLYRRRALGFGVYAFVVSLISAPLADAQTLFAPAAFDEAETRALLAHIETAFPAEAPAARKSRELLEEPPQSQRGRLARNRSDRGARRIVNGVTTPRHGAVAALLRGGDAGSAVPLCTGTLVGCRTILTAAHCIQSNPAPGAYSVFFPSVGFFKVASIAWQPDAYRLTYADLALLTLSEPVKGIAPIGLNTATSPPTGAVATIVGYGRSGGARFDYGIKREGTV
jgi:hypothetical protein